MKSPDPEVTDGNPEGEEQPGELPKMPEMKRGSAHLHRKRRHQQQMKELQEERVKMGQTMEGFMSMQQESQQQMLMLERQVEQLKEREKQKAIEIHKWQTSSEDFQKDCMRLKKQLALVTERLAKAEKSGVEPTLSSTADLEASEKNRVAVEQLQMRLADYESLVVEFAEQANSVVEDPDALEPLNLSTHFAGTEEYRTAKNVAYPDTYESQAVEMMDDVRAEPTPSAESSRAFCVHLESEIKGLEQRCKDEEAKTKAAALRCVEAEAEVESAGARLTKAEADAAAALQTSRDLQLAADAFRTRNLQLEMEAETAVSRCVMLETEAEIVSARDAKSSALVVRCAELEVEVQESASRCSLLERQVQDASVHQADAASSAIRCANLEAQVESSVARCAELEAQVEVARERAAELSTLTMQHANLRAEAEASFAQCLTLEVQMRSASDDASTSAARCADMEAEVQASVSRYNRADAELQAAQHALEESVANQLQAERSMAELHKQRALVERRHLTALRNAQTGYLILHEVNRNLKQQFDRSLSMKREVRRAQSGLTLMRVLQLPMGKREMPTDILGTHDQAQDIDMLRKELKEHQSNLADLELCLLSTQSAKDEVTKQLAIVQLQFQEHKQQSAALQHVMADEPESLANLDRLESELAEVKFEAKAAAEMAKTLQAQLEDAAGKDEPLLEDKLNMEHALSSLADETMASKAEAAQYHHQLDIVTEELLQLRMQVDVSEKQVDALQTELEEVRAFSKVEHPKADAQLRIEQYDMTHCVKTDAAGSYKVDERWKVISQERSALEGRMQVLQDHLEQETEHFDALASAHEEVLTLSDQLKSEKVRLEMQLGASQQECAAAREVLVRTIAGAQAELTRVHEEQRIKAEQMQDSFLRQIDACTRKAEEAVGALQAEKAAKVMLEQESCMLATQVEEELAKLENEIAARQAAAIHLDQATGRCSALERQLELSDQRFSKVTEDLSQVEAKSIALQRQLAEQETEASESSSAWQQELSWAKTSWHQSVSECTVLKQELNETADWHTAVKRCPALEQQLAEANECWQRSAVQCKALEQQLSSSALQQAQAADERLQSLEGQLAESAASLQQSMTEHGSLHQQLTEASETLQQLVARQDEGQRTLCKFEAQIVQLRLEEQEAKEELNSQRARAEKMLAEEATKGAVARDEAVAQATHGLQAKIDQLQRSLYEELMEASCKAQEMLAALHAERATKVSLEEERCTLAVLVKDERDKFQKEAAAKEFTMVQLNEVTARVADLEKQLTLESTSAQAERMRFQHCLDEAAESQRQDEAKYVALQRLLNEREALAGESSEALEQQLSQRCCGLERQLAELNTCWQESTSRQSLLEQKMSESASFAEVRQKVLQQQLAETETQWRESVMTCDERAQALQALEAQLRNLQEKAVSEAVAQQSAAEKTIAEQAAKSAQEQEIAVAVAKQQLQQHMQDEAQRYMHALHEQARAAIAHRDRQLIDLGQKLAASEGQLKELREHHQAKASQMGIAVAERDTLKEQLETLTQKLISVEDAYAISKQDIIDSAAAAAECDFLRQKGVDAAEKIQTVSMERDALNQELESLIQKLGALQKERDASAQVNQELSIVMAECDALRQKVMQADQQLSTKALEQDMLNQQLEGLGLKFAALQEDRDCLLQKLSVTSDASQELAVVMVESDALRQKLSTAGQELAAAAAERDTLKQQLSGLNHHLIVLQGERNELVQQLTEHSNAVEELRAATAECGALREQLTDVGKELGAASSLKQQLEFMGQQLSAAQEERDILRQRCISQCSTSQATDMANPELAPLRQQRQLNSTVSEPDTDSPVEFGASTDESNALKQQLTIMGRQLYALQEERDLLKQQCPNVAQEHGMLSAEYNQLRQELAAASQELDQQAAQASAERKVLESAFTSQMEQVQRSLSAKTIEAETLRQQLAEAAARASPALTAASVLVPEALATAQVEQQLKAQTRQLQLRISAVEEEKTTMIEHMREHIRQLARENYDLKQQSVAAFAGAQVPSKTGDSNSREGDRTSLSNSQSSEGSGTWLSYVLSPFLTDSDMREIHADSYVDETFKSGPQLVLT